VNHCFCLRVNKLEKDLFFILFITAQYNTATYKWRLKIDERRLRLIQYIFLPFYGEQRFSLIAIEAWIESTSAHDGGSTYRFVLEVDTLRQTVTLHSRPADADC